MGRYLDIARQVTTATPSEAAKWPPAGMTLADFARSARQLTVRSAVLDADVIFAADNLEAVRNPRGLVVYAAAELALLAGADPDVLRLLNAAKVEFGAPIKPDDLSR